MQSLIQPSGNIVLFMSKKYPEISDTGIQYDCGVSKKCFHIDTNHIAQDHEVHVHLALSKVTPQVVKNTSRKARLYMQAYANKYGGSHVLVRKFVEIRKCHQSILDQETLYLEGVMVRIN